MYALVGVQGSGDVGIDHRLLGARMTWSLGMPLVLALHIALRAMARHALRSGLAMLGISIGIAAFICSVGVGYGASRQVEAQIRNLGENLI
jgi:hypothetical protein